VAPGHAVIDDSSQYKGPHYLSPFPRDLDGCLIKGVHVFVPRFKEIGDWGGDLLLEIEVISCRIRNRGRPGNAEGASVRLTNSSEALLTRSHPVVVVVMFVVI